MTPDTYGPTSPTPSAHYDPDSQCWRTSQGTLLSAERPSLDRLPAWGMTRGGALFELPTPVRLTAARDSSSSLPTPRATDGTKGGPNQRGSSGDLMLPSAVAQLLPTPVADHSRGLPSASTDYASLPNVAASLLPTPAVNDMGAGKTPEAWDEWTAKMRAKYGNGHGHGKSLSIEAARLTSDPTPPQSTGGKPC